MAMPSMVLMADRHNTYRVLDVAHSPTSLKRRLSGIRVIAGGGLSITEGSLTSDGTVGMNFEFPAGRPGNASLFGPCDELAPYDEGFDGTVAWLLGQGRYRWGWRPVLGAGATALLLLLLAGLWTVIAALEGEHLWLTLTFLAVTGAAAVGSIGFQARKLLVKERERISGVVVRRAR